MSFKSSEGLRDALLAEMKTQLDLGFLYIYDDTAAEPSSANDALPGASVMLVKISNNKTATGITFATPGSGIILKAAAEVWAGDIIPAGGTALWYRFVAVGDTEASSTTEARLQGSVGVVNADLLVASTTFIGSQEQRVDYFAVGLPAS